MDQDQLASKMGEVLQRELDLFREMERFSRDQLAALSAESPDVETAARLMAEKQAIVNRLDDLDASSQETKTDWQRVAQELPEEKREGVRRLAMEVASVLETLMAIEKENEAKLRECSAEVNKELACLQRARLVARAYRNQFGPEDARFVDRKQ